KLVLEGSLVAVWDVSLAPGERFEAEVEVADVLDASVVGKFKPPKVVPHATSQPVVLPSVTPVVVQPVAARSDGGVLYAVAVLFLVAAGLWLWTRRKANNLA
ncbi:hypothetical protein HYV43_07460, partial [Candidatus Micrarchaeota archaeon]|nr:hypothetical protein [Candidatus Micrarchaeota archaeon]